MKFFFAIVKENIIDNDKVLFKKGQTIFFRLENSNKILLLSKKYKKTFDLEKVLPNLVPVRNDQGLFHFIPKASKLANFYYEKLRAKDEKENKKEEEQKQEEKPGDNEKGS